MSTKGTDSELYSSFCAGNRPWAFITKTVPTDGTAGYPPGAICVHGDGSVGDSNYINEGSVTSCDFNRMVSVHRAAGADSASGLLFGIGTTADPATTATADAKFIELRCETTAATGDNRLLYMEYSIGGASGGECLRANTIVDGNTGTAHGAHVGMEFLATAGGSECSGLGCAFRSTLMIPNVASWAPTGTYAAGMFEIYSVGTSSDPAGMTELSVLRICNSGDATGGDDVDTDAFLMSFQGWTAAANTTTALSSVALAEIGISCVGLKIRIGSATYRLIAVPEAEWN